MRVVFFVTIETAKGLQPSAPAVPLLVGLSLQTALSTAESSFHDVPRIPGRASARPERYPTIAGEA